MRHMTSSACVVQTNDSQAWSFITATCRRILIFQNINAEQTCLKRCFTCINHQILKPEGTTHYRRHVPDRVLPVLRVRVKPRVASANHVQGSDPSSRAILQLLCTKSSNHRAPAGLFFHLTVPELCFRNVGAKLAGRNLFEEELVDLFERSALGFGMIEEQVDAAQDGCTSKKERYLGLEVGGVGIEEVREREAPHGLLKISNLLLFPSDRTYVPKTLVSQGKVGSAVPQAGRADFRHGNKRRGADSGVVQVAVEQDQSHDSLD